MATAEEVYELPDAAVRYVYRLLTNSLYPCNAAKAADTVSLVCISAHGTCAAAANHRM
jgi:hypothetical protein